MKRALAAALGHVVDRMDKWSESHGTPPYGGRRPPAEVCGFWRDNKWCGQPAVAWFRDEREPGNGMCATHEREWCEGVAEAVRILRGQ